jgi:hypothetical protein
VEAAAITATATAVSVILGFIVALVRIAITSERRRADDWRTAAQTQAEANAVQADNLNTLVVTVGKLATTQDRMMAILQGLATTDRSAP